MRVYIAQDVGQLNSIAPKRALGDLHGHCLQAPRPSIHLRRLWHHVLSVQRCGKRVIIVDEHDGCMRTRKEAIQNDELP